MTTSGSCWRRGNNRWRAWRHRDIPGSKYPSDHAHLTPRYRRVLGFFPRLEYPSDHAHLTLPISTDPWILHARLRDRHGVGRWQAQTQMTIRHRTERRKALPRVRARLSETRRRPHQGRPILLSFRVDVLPEYITHRALVLPPRSFRDWILVRGLDPDPTSRWCQRRRERIQTKALATQATMAGTGWATMNSTVPAVRYTLPCPRIVSMAL